MHTFDHVDDIRAKGRLRDVDDVGDLVGGQERHVLALGRVSQHQVLAHQRSGQIPPRLRPAHGFQHRVERLARRPDARPRVAKVLGEKPPVFRQATLEKHGADAFVRQNPEQNAGRRERIDGARFFVVDHHQGVRLLAEGNRRLVADLQVVQPHLGTAPPW